MKITKQYISQRHYEPALAGEVISEIASFLAMTGHCDLFLTPYNLSLTK